MIYHCCDQKRRDAVNEHPLLNGIDYLEVVDRELPDKDALRQKTLLLRFLKPVAGLKTENLILSGGDPGRNPHIQWVEPASPLPQKLSEPEEINVKKIVTALDHPTHVLLIRVDATGDYSTYRLQLRRSLEDNHPPKDFDPRLAEIEFSFKVECPSDFDCKIETFCQKEPQALPDINYLAKDYDSFRRLLLDRLTHLVPDWRERSAADIGVTIAEVLAYVGDHLSYEQDAVATEAYLETARKRVSLRRHALLVDYHTHDGCNARTWVQLQVDTDVVDLLQTKGTRFYTCIPGLPWLIRPDSNDDREALQQKPTVFEPVPIPIDYKINLFQAHNHISIYTWGDHNCCLLKGSTKATLVGHLPKLQVGDLLLFEEVKGPITGMTEDADATRRHIVRLTAVNSTSTDDPKQPLTDPLYNDPSTAPRTITEVAWASEDALPFQFCVSATTDKGHGEKFIEDVSVARGNLVLCDHGMTLPNEEFLGTVPTITQSYRNDSLAPHCASPTQDPVPPRFYPKLAESPLTFVEYLDKVSPEFIKRQKPEQGKKVLFDPYAPAVTWINRKDTTAKNKSVIPVIRLTSSENWEPVNDLLNSNADGQYFVVEVEHDGTSYLRFGNDKFGKRPNSGSSFSAQYRIGNGRAGNIGADTIKHIVTSADGIILGVRNPLPAYGGLDPETAAQVRRRAPQAFRTQERAVTTDDYAEVTQRLDGVQRAAATLRWTGSWYTVFITVDRFGGVPLDQAFKDKLSQHVEQYRMAGHDLEFNDPIYVSLELEMLVCVKADYFRSDVRKGLLNVLGSRRLPDGRLGVFHSDNLSFGQTVFLGPIYAAAHAVAGVASVQITRFARKDRDDPHSAEEGFLKFGRLEIPRLENDPNYPDHGVLRLQLVGGK
ncbi:putative phage Mu protein gp47-like protein [Crenothrix polyspora]|uniref:Putative phage Mu protein gp47-like protein n=1 Tax=Crenothrix polyspora TaxID=360316 RepID=A0A1R4HDB5_9GAMM|nr:putative baseplate assembly protein [Crenothrix polyspora]SJM94204.1 putative phage Mu protein gp47-like protein [Crenothrix polyspora]